MIKKLKNKISIKTRILVSILILIITIFSGIVISFNLLVHEYIEKSSREQLQKATFIVENFDENYKPRRGQHNKYGEPQDIFSNFLQGIQDKIKMAEMESDAQAMVIDENYNMIFPSSRDAIFLDLDKYKSILKYIQKHEINLDSDKEIKISTGPKDYYISTVKLNSLESNDSLYMVLFIDVSSTIDLAQKVNYVLIAIMIIAGILAIIISIILAKNIANPIQELCEFAKSIGDGSFEKCSSDFKDKELDELCKVMNKSVEKLDKYDKDQKTFFQNASHELRTPLMSIKGYAEAIKYNVIDKDRASDVILEESDRLTDMVEDLLYLSKMDNITKDYSLVESDMREILSNCTLKEKPTAIKNSISFKYEFDDNPVILKCDEKSIYRAFLNIIDNALRYAKSDIILGCKKEDNKIVIFIENDGDKIPEKDLNHIFDRFYKGSKGKHGIGLSIVKSIINKHKGKIYVENNNVGVRFTIVFELQQ